MSEPTDIESTHAAEELAFATWLARVDMALIRRLGLTTDDLPNIDYRGMHAEGLTPSEAARQAILNANQ